MALALALNVDVRKCPAAGHCVHRIEEALVSDAIAAGQPVHRRSDAPPLAVLGIRIVEAKESRAA
jgi:hypothetical protein